MKRTKQRPALTWKLWGCSVNRASASSVLLFISREMPVLAIFQSFIVSSAVAIIPVKRILQRDSNNKNLPPETSTPVGYAFVKWKTSFHRAELSAESLRQGHLLARAYWELLIYCCLKWLVQQSEKYIRDTRNIPHIYVTSVPVAVTTVVTGLSAMHPYERRISSLRKSRKSYFYRTFKI